MPRRTRKTPAQPSPDSVAKGAVSLSAEDVEEFVVAGIREARKTTRAIRAEFGSDVDFLVALLRRDPAPADLLSDCRFLLDRLGTLSELDSASRGRLESLCEEGGCTISGEYVRRRLDSARAIEESLWLQRAQSGPVATNLVAVQRYLTRAFIGKKQEKIGLLYLNSRNMVLGFEIVAKGRYNVVNTDVKTILASVFRFGADGFIISHNHPSGVVTPSEADIALTRKIQGAAEFVGLRMFDHIIVGGDRLFSFRMAGLTEDPPH